MRAMGIDGFGGSDKLRPMALPRPKPEAGELLLRVVAAGVNPIDVEIREGLLDGSLPHRFPLVPGWDAAGIVEELGPGATRFRKGQRVWACALKPTIQWGCYAEFVAVPERQASTMPAKLLFEEAASVPVAALTAHQCLSDGGPTPGPGATVLVLRGSGGVGHFALQLAREAGARVLATAGPKNQSFVLSLGAQVGIDYTAEDLVEAVRRHAPGGADLVIDAVGGETLARAHELVKPGGRLVSIVDEPDGEIARARGFAAHALRVEPNGEQLLHLARLFDQRKLRTEVQKIFALGEAAAAQDAVRAGHVRGKVVLNL